MIQPNTYEYIDKVESWNDNVYGFIAQRVGEVISEAVTTEKSVIPNIFKLWSCVYDTIKHERKIFKSWSKWWYRDICLLRHNHHFLFN